MPPVKLPGLHESASHLSQTARRAVELATSASSRAPSARFLDQEALIRRQQVIAIPTLYQNQDNSPNPGAVVGIVLGSVAAFIVLIWLFVTVTGRNQSTIVTEDVVSTSRRRSRSPARSRRSRRTTERRSGERRVIQERIVRDTSRVVPGRTTYVEEETVRPVGGGMVEVVEDGDSSVVTAPRRPRRGSRR